MLSVVLFLIFARVDDSLPWPQRFTLWWFICWRLQLWTTDEVMLRSHTYCSALKKAELLIGQQLFGLHLFPAADQVCSPKSFIKNLLASGPVELHIMITTVDVWVTRRVYYALCFCGGTRWHARGRASIDAPDEGGVRWGGGVCGGVILNNRLVLNGLTGDNIWFFFERASAEAAVRHLARKPVWLSPPSSALPTHIPWGPLL